MKRTLMTLACFLVLAAALAVTGCAPMPYQGPYYAETEVIIIYEPVPVPYPLPVEVGGYEPLPERHKPLKKPSGSETPRIKTPRGDRSEELPVVARGGERPPAQDSRTTKKPGPSRR